MTEDTDTEIPAWMLGLPEVDPAKREPVQARPATGEGAGRRGWWSLPLAGWAWGEDAEEYEQ